MFNRRAAARQSCLRAPRNIAAALLALTMAATAVVVTASVPKAPPVAVPVTEAPDTGSALVAARAQGTEVEALSMRTSTREVFAQPDGQLKALVSAVPQRVRRDGRWMPIDTALTPEGESVAPKATEVGLTFSGGGEAEPLVRLSRNGKSFALTWPGKLPAPSIEGSTAKYAGILPGVDLRMTAKNDGYEQVFVVNTREAARHVRNIRLGMKAEGLELKPGADGAFDLVDGAGTKIFEVPASRMWDSKKREYTDAPRTDRELVGVEFAADALTLLPHQGLLDDPATVYPVFIDPAPIVAGNDGWTTVYDDGTNAMRNGTHWNGKDTEAEDPKYWWIKTNPTARSGQAYGWNLKTRTYFQYNTSFLADKDISSARLDVTVVHSPTCNVESNHRLYQSQWDVGSNTNWNNQPADWGVISEIAVPSVYGNCSGHKSLSFTSPNFPAQIDKTGNSTFSIRAAEEGDQNYWRKFDPGATKLVIYYNGTPNTPGSPATEPDPAACANCGGMPWVGDSTIRLRSTVSDPDGDQVNAIWDVYDDVVPGDPAKQNKRVFTSGPHGSGSVAVKDVPLTEVADDRLVTWYVAASDGLKTSGYRQGPKQFRVDRTPPVNKPDVTSLAYPEDNRWHGGTTVQGKFTFSAKDADIDRFDYGWDDATTSSIAADRLGGQATVALTPPGDGPRDLFVRARDKAGNAGPVRVYRIYVRAGSGAIAQYTLDGNVNDSAYLGDRNGTTQGNVSYTTGAVGSALNLDGSGAYATAPNAVRTDSSFSVSAWVKVDAVDGNWGTAVSQDGNATCGFCLRYEGGSRRWVFLMPNKDSVTENTVVFVRSTEEPTPGAWTHLTGVYDADNRQVKLYVNGELQGTTQASATPWNAAGGLRIGQSKVGTGSDTWWRGGIDEVRMYDRALTDAEVRGEVRRDNVQAGHWRFEEDLSTIARNSVANGESAALSGGVSFFEQRPQPKNRVLRFDGTGQVRTTGPVVRTDKSFTVSANVMPADTNGPMTVLSQDGPNSSGFVLQQRDGRWLFGMTEGNGNTAWNVLAQSAPGTAVARTPTHLAAVFDSGTKKATLYVNGVEAAVSAAAAKPFWDSAGAFVMGNDQQGAALRGDLDDVRVYSRTLAADEIGDIVKLDADPVRQWRLDGDGVDTSGYNGTATLGDPVDWVGGQSDNSDPRDLGVRLTGVPGANLSAGHAVDTSRSFSVSAWARLDKIGGAATVLSQDGNTTSAFQLQATQDGKWSFAMFAKDEPGGGPRRDRAIGPVAQQGMWTHLVGTYDATRDLMTLYVNGVAVATAAHPDAWDRPDGQIRIGRGQWNSTDVDWFPGAIDDVEVYNRVLFADEIRAKAGRDLNLVNKWQFDEGTGTTAGDSVGGKAGTLTNATYAPGRLGNAVSFNGTNAEVSTGAVARTDQNFTVSAWVKLPGGCSSTCKRVAVSQDGERNSKFRLGFLKDRDRLGNWVFEMTEDDTDATKVTVAAVSAEVDDFTGWVHLTGVYDSAAKQVLLYVEGNRVGEGRVNSTWQPKGFVQIGRAKLNSAPAERWVGSVDDVRLYTGALDNEGVFALYRSYPPTDQPTATLPVADAARWKMGEKTGTTIADSSGRGKTASAVGGFSWIGGPTGNGVLFDGATGYAETSGPVLDTSRSFSVSTWVYVNEMNSGNRGILAQDGNRVSSFVLQYNADSGRWGVVMPKADQDNPDSNLVLSTEPAANSKWTHLAAVYDADLKQLKLYVNGVLSGVKLGVVGWNATGQFSIGRNKWNGIKGSPLQRGVDDVRVFGKALSDGEVLKLEEDTPANAQGQWQFDGNGNDLTWRRLDASFTGGTTWETGVIGQAVKLDGTASASTQSQAVDTRNSFTVSAWVKLARDDRTGTIVAQDGTRTSAFALQYRSDSKRWAFGASSQDSDVAPMVFATSAEQAVVDDWTHLTGVYDHGNARLRLYVNGVLSGTRENVRMWPADGAFTIGRALTASKQSDRFTGSIDELRVDERILPDNRLFERANWPKPAPGQFGRFLNGKGDRYTGTTDQVRAGYRFEGTLGMPVPDGPNTRMLYTCQRGSDLFTSMAADCEGQTKLGEAGRMYTTQPTNVPTIPIYRCFTGTDRFESRVDSCEGMTKEGLLGYTLAYAPLARYITLEAPWDHWSSVYNVSPGYRYEGVLGYVGLTAESGTTPLMSCKNGYDAFSSVDVNCEGKTQIASMGRIWTAPPSYGRAAVKLLRAKPGYGNLLDTTNPNWDGYPPDRELGYVLTAAPNVTATF